MRSPILQEAKKANKAWMGELWQAWKVEVAKNRDLKPEDIQNFADNAHIFIKKEKGDIATALLKANLIDKLLNRTQTREYLMDKMGKSEDEKTFSQISAGDYYQVIKSEESLISSENEIAIIVAQGTILDGSHPPGIIGGDSTASLIRESHENKKVKAIVLRVDSGGGSAFASEVIREEIVAAKSKGIKVIASMSNVAASGGYWISASADEIWASHNTITGSIGIFGFIPTFERTLEEIGIHTDGVATTKIGGGMNAFRKLDPALGEILQSSIEFGYERFIGLVADERDMTKEDVNKIAQGRVWDGKTALSLGLVDHLGNLKEATERAAKLAKVENFKTIFPAEQADWKTEIFNQLFSQAYSITPPFIISSVLVKKSRELLEEIGMLNDPKGVYALCLDCYL